MPRTLYSFCLIGLLLMGCSKDKDSTVNKNCGIVFYGTIGNSDYGGFSEHKMAELCGDGLADFIEYCKNQEFHYEIIYDGQKRKKCQYVVLGYIRRDGVFNKTSYVRYVNGVTQEVIEFWESQGFKKDASKPNDYRYEVAELTGLEDFYQE